MLQADVFKTKMIIVLGSPGSGKGTQCEKLAWEYGYNHISAGELLREEASKPCSEYSHIILENMNSGGTVPVDITFRVIKKFIDKSLIKRFILDAFPINQDNLFSWITKMSDNVDILVVIFLEVPDDVCLRRCLQRGLQGSGRSDDMEIIIRKRIQRFYDDSMVVLKYFDDLGVLKTIDGSRSEEDVFNDIKDIINKMQEKL